MRQTLRIATFNLENLDDHPGGGIEFEDRIAVLRPQLLRLRADVLCLQEVNAHRESRRGPRLFAALDRLLAGTPYEGMERIGSLDRGGVHPAEIAGAPESYHAPVVAEFSIPDP